MNSFTQGLKTRRGDASVKAFEELVDIKIIVKLPTVNPPLLFELTFAGSDESPDCILESYLINLSFERII